MTHPERVVIDANVGVAVVLAEPLRPQGLKLLGAAARGEVQISAPINWSLEAANACWKRARQKKIGVQDAVGAVSSLKLLDLSFVETSILNEHAIALALEFRTSTYDALYVAAAEFLDATLVTADGRLLGALRQGRWRGSVIHLEDWS